MLAELTLGSIRGEWINLEARIDINDEDVRAAVQSTDWLPDQRTYNSWLQAYQLRTWFDIRIVPVDILLERSNETEAYSGYTKGYGEGGRRLRETTPYSSELDGETGERLPPEFNLFEVEAYQRILIALEANKSKRIQGNK
jgi:hypothetical protein